MIYDLSKRLEIDATHDESKYVEVEIAGQKVKIPNWYNLNSVIKYFESYKIDENYRKAFCNLVFIMIDENFDEDNITLGVEDIELLSDGELIKIIDKYLDNYQESNTYFKEVFREDYFEAFYLMIKKIKSEMEKQLSGTMGNLNKKILGSIKPINEYSKIIGSYIVQINKTISELLKYIPKLEVNWEALEKNQKELAKKMIRNGWYCTYRLPINVKELIQLNDREFNRAICQFYEEELDDMCKTILLRFPKRLKILSKCFNAHNNKDYELCIPTMLAQADGISDELFNSLLFKKNRFGEPLTKNQTNIMFDTDSFVDIAYYLQLSITGQLNKSCTNPKFFNRHTVMHGKDVYYAKKINSIRCISILNFLAEIKEYYVDDKNSN